MRVKRFPENPIIHPGLDESIETNINGPSLIRVPPWVEDPLGKYYLYFAHHKGSFIRLAYADALKGPWRVHAPGALHLEQTPCYNHIASPDVHVDEENRQIVMYYHGPVIPKDEAKNDPLTQRYPFLGGQRSLAAVSDDGLNFTSGKEYFGPSYFRVFRWKDYFYALAMPGIFYRSKDGFTNFKKGPTLFTDNMRHAALLPEDDVLHIFYTNVGDRPESILHTQIKLTANWRHWKKSEDKTILSPDKDYEGGELKPEPSKRGVVAEHVRELRDPCIFQEDGRIYLLYCVAGESGIAIAEIFF